jgi:hypothetical protein
MASHNQTSNVEKVHALLLTFQSKRKRNLSFKNNSQMAEGVVVFKAST